MKLFIKICYVRANVLFKYSSFSPIIIKQYNYKWDWNEHFYYSKEYIEFGTNIPGNFSVDINSRIYNIKDLKKVLNVK